MYNNLKVNIDSVLKNVSFKLSVAVILFPVQCKDYIEKGNSCRFWFYNEVLLVTAKFSVQRIENYLQAIDIAGFIACICI